MANAAVVNRTQAMGSNLVQQYFNVPSAIATPLRSGSYSAYAPNAICAASFGDANLLAQAISSGTLPQGTTAVVYDCEKWSFTPTDQQLDPATYYQQAADAAHAAGLPLVATPATDLVYAIAPGTPPSQRYSEFLQLGIPAAAAQYADYFVAQTQGLVASPQCYAYVSAGIAQQATGANPNVEVLAGLSTNPNGVTQSTQALLDAASASKPYVSGWWLNDPAQGPQCPNCTGPHPDMVVGFLNGLGTL
jgi:hypothetical protein